MNGKCLLPSNGKEQRQTMGLNKEYFFSIVLYLLKMAGSVTQLFHSCFLLPYSVNEPEGFPSKLQPIYHFKEYAVCFVNITKQTAL